MILIVRRKNLIPCSEKHRVVSTPIGILVLKKSHASRYWQTNWKKIAAILGDLPIEYLDGRVKWSLEQMQHLNYARKIMFPHFHDQLILKQTAWLTRRVNEFVSDSHSGTYLFKTKFLHVSTENPKIWMLITSPALGSFHASWGYLENKFLH